MNYNAICELIKSKFLSQKLLHEYAPVPITDYYAASTLFILLAITMKLVIIKMAYLVITRPIKLGPIAMHNSILEFTLKHRVCNTYYSSKTVRQVGVIYLSEIVALSSPFWILVKHTPIKLTIIQLSYIKLSSIFDNFF